MKTTLAIILAAGIGVALASLVVSNRQAARFRAQLAEQQAAWQAERAELEAALMDARARAAQVPARVAPVPTAATPVPAAARLSPLEILAKLEALRPSVSGGSSRSIREAVYWLEELVHAGPTALPAIRECLARNRDLDLDTSWFQSKAARGGNLPGDFLLPPSLRFGLFEVARQIGGVDAEKLLAETLTTTGRGVEVAYLTRVLQELAPNKYRDQALTVAHDLLASSFAVNSPSALDRNHRDYLYGVLMFYNDTSYASTAQGQLLQADGQLDGSALKYLQQALGPQAVPAVAQAYQDPRITADAAKKEPLARLALNYVGADAQANEFYQKAINDMVLTKSHRANLIEDLNETGFRDPKNLTAQDLPLIQNRIALLEQLAPSATDPVNLAAFKEAYKDLINMRETVTRPPAPPPVPAGHAKP